MEKNDLYFIDKQNNNLDQRASRNLYRAVLNHYQGVSDLVSSTFNVKNNICVIQN